MILCIKNVPARKKYKTRYTYYLGKNVASWIKIFLNVRNMAVWRKQQISGGVYIWAVIRWTETIFSRIVTDLNRNFEIHLTWGWFR